MFHFFRYPYANYKPVKYVVNPVRCVEAFLCAACLAIAIMMVIILPKLSLTVKIIITLVAAAFTIITIIDIISNSSMTPIYWHTWVLFAITGALTFFLCAGFLITTYKEAIIILIIGIILFAITAIIFLLDTFLILHALRKRGSEVWPENVEETTQMPEPGAGLICECMLEAVEELDATEVTTIEKHIETKRSTSTRHAMIQEIQDERIIEHIEGPSQKQRSVTSYGGTFAVDKDAAPLPSPEPQYTKERSRNSLSRSRSNVSKPISQTVIKKSSGKIYKGEDGRTYLADGTHVTQIRLETGELGYRDPNGIIYTKDGVPIILNGEHRMQVIKESSRQHVTTQGLIFKRGDWYTPDGRKVPKVHKTSNGTWVTENGVPLYEIGTGADTLYESPDNFLYTATGQPIGYNPNIEEETTYTYKDGITVKSKESHRVSNNRLQESEQQRIEWHKPPPTSERRESLAEQHPIDSKLKISSRSESGVIRSGTRSEIIKSREVVCTVENEPDSEDSRSNEKINKSRKGRCRMYLPDGTPLNEIITTHGSVMYEGPDGELYTSDGTPIYANRIDNKLCVSPCLPCRKTEGSRSGSCTSPLHLDRGSRTVAISTRMVPRGQKAMSAPGSPDMKQGSSRSIKSADSALGSVQKQKPCACGVMCACGNIHYPAQQEQNKTICSGPCENKDCFCAKRKEEYVSQSSPGTSQETVDKPQLQTISECDCETDALMWQNPPSTTETPNSSQPTSSAHVPEIIQRSLGSDSVQTSETRMVKASDIERLNAMLPGATNRRK